MKRIVVIFLMTSLICILSKGQESDTLIYTNPEVQPHFTYDTCSDTYRSIRKYFMVNYKMPNELLDCGYTGIIFASFIIERDSLISNIKLLRGIHDPLDKSVIETIQSMPKWSPGINNGKNVRAQYTIPVSINWLYGNIEE
jgi:periplasmic protein TonB